MKLIKNISNGLSKMTGRTGLIVQKHSPEILLVAGIGGVVASAVLACRATLKVEEVLYNHRETIDKINDCFADERIPAEDYTEADHKKDLTVAYVQTGVTFVKLYGPAITLGIASVVCIIGSHGIMKKRNVAVVAAYKAIEEGFKVYRQRVIEEHGEKTDYMYKNGLREEIVTETEVGADGKPHKVKKSKMALAEGDTNGLSVYARFYDESCTEWSKTPEYNFMFLRAQQNYCNDLLKARGHLFLNEVYKLLGIPHSKAGAVAGWVIGKDGDNFVDFGIFDGDRQKAREFVNGYERSILLDFNVDGVIYDLI